MLDRYSCDLQFVASGLVQNHGACRRQKGVMSQRAGVPGINCAVKSFPVSGVAFLEQLAADYCANDCGCFQLAEEVRFELTKGLLPC